MIPDRVTCEGCEVQLEEVQRFGDRAGEELFGLPSRWIAGDRSGAVWIGSHRVRRAIQIYGPGRAYRELERPGDGPGEFRSVSLLSCFDNGLLMLTGDGRFQEIDPDRMTLSHLSRVPDIGRALPTSMLQVADSIVWISSPSRSPRLLGAPILEVNPFAGTVVRPLGRSVDHFDSMVERHATRVLTRLPDDRILAAAEYSYGLEVYDRSGDLVASFERVASWFPPQMEAEIRAAVTSVLVLDSRRIVVFVMVRDPAVPPALPEQPDDLTAAERWNTVIEVLEVVDRAVLARAEVPQLVLGPVCPGNRLAALEPGGIVDHLVLFTLLFDGREPR